MSRWATWCALVRWNFSGVSRGKALSSGHLQAAGGRGIGRSGLSCSLSPAPRFEVGQSGRGEMAMGPGDAQSIPNRGLPEHQPQEGGNSLPGNLDLAPGLVASAAGVSGLINFAPTAWLSVLYCKTEAENFHNR